MPKQLCTCGNNRKNNESCNNCSQYKMVFLLRDKQSPFKIRGTAGKEVNPAFWSFLKEDKRPRSVIIKNMVSRAKRMPQWNASNYLMIYERNGNLIEKVHIC